MKTVTVSLLAVCALLVQLPALQGAPQPVRRNTANLQEQVLQALYAVTNGQSSPYAADRQPAADGQYPYAADRQPAADGQYPYAADRQPAANGQYQYAANRQPAADGQYPYSAKIQPSYAAGGQFPYDANRQPAAGGQFPYDANRQPAAGGQFPYAANKPSHAVDGQFPQPLHAADEQFPYDADRQPSHAADGQFPYDANRQRPAAGGQFPYDADRQPSAADGQYPYDANGPTPYPADGQPSYAVNREPSRYNADGQPSYYATDKKFPTRFSWDRVPPSPWQRVLYQKKIEEEAKNPFIATVGCGLAGDIVQAAVETLDKAFPGAVSFYLECGHPCTSVTVEAPLGTIQADVDICVDPDTGSTCVEDDAANCQPSAFATAVALSIPVGSAYVPAILKVDIIGQQCAAIEFNAPLCP